MPRIVQFLHTATEATPSDINSNKIEWNNHPDHRRKFILSEGKFERNGREEKEMLTFWGEWEPQSAIEKLKNTKAHLPSYLNKPFLDPSVPNRTHNTDPYVFGSNFRYIVCKQGFSEILRNLDPYSLILFGSRIDKEFCLDTLFVVSENSSKYNFENIEDVFKTRNQYYYASVNPLYDDTKYNPEVSEEDSCRIETDKEYSFYQGVNFKEKELYNGIYSFVPCKIYMPEKERDYVFRQPKINLDIISEKQAQGINACKGRDFTKDEILNYWKEIVRQVENANLLKGVYFKNPALRI